MLQHKKEICKAAALLYKKDILTGCEGNLSCRVKEKKAVLITASQKHKAFLDIENKEHFSLLSIIDSKVLEGGVPSSEKAMHLQIYKNLPLVNAVIHAHPPYATALSVAYPHLSCLPGEYLSEVIPIIGKVPILNYQRPGTENMGNDFQKHFKNTQAFILAHHGAIVWGKNIKEAFSFMECLEHNAKIIFLSLSSKEAQSLDTKEVAHLWDLHERFSK